MLGHVSHVIVVVLEFLTYSTPVFHGFGVERSFQNRELEQEAWGAFCAQSKTLIPSASLWL